MAQTRRDAILGMLARGDATAAENACDDYLRAGGGGDALYLSGLVRARLGDLASARRLVGRAAQLQPGRADIAYNFGVMLRDAGELVAAAAEWRRASDLDPARSDALGNLALALDELGEPEAARACWRRILARRPDHRDSLYNYANFLQRRDERDEALATYETLLAAHPDYARGWVNLGMLRKRQGQLALAEAAYRRAIALDGKSALAHFNLSNLLLTQGRLAEGFAEYEWRAELPGAMQNPWKLPVWTGREPPGTRVLLWADQGFGDALQFLRYVPQVAARGHRCILVLRPELHRVAAMVAGVVEVRLPDADMGDVDAHLALSSLPHRLGRTMPDWSGPYLAVPEGVRPPAEAEGAIGLIWAGDPRQPYDADRSAPLASLAPLLDLPGTRWVSLQVGERSADLARSPWVGRIPDLGARFGDFADTAAAMARLRLVISTDTSTAHLAGALGRPGWVMLPAFECDWRWGEQAAISPWYPTLRLFRQPARADWHGLAERMAAALREEGEP